MGAPRTLADAPLASSFRDPSGFVFHRDGRLLRQVNLDYREHYDALLESGLYDELVAARHLVPHEERPLDWAIAAGAYKVIEPRSVQFVTYPYEWCFGQLRDAALLTLDIEKRSLARGMTLKDASAFNIQTDRGSPILIDTLSFERYREGDPWVAYRQFCQHFLAPLALMAFVDARLVRLLERYLDGIPLDLASRALPKRTWARPALLLHVHLHARSIRRYANASRQRVDRSRRVGPAGRQGLVSHLEAAVRRLSWDPQGTEWSEYETTHAYSTPARAEKESIVAEWLQGIGPKTVWDLGANVGVFSRIAARQGAQVLAIDADPGALERLYREIRQAGETRILPLFIDLANPSPAVGWANLERQSLMDRGPADVILALALIHHLAITNNTPLERIAEFLARLGAHLIVEFVPKSDPQVQRLLTSREDIFVDYTREEFERAFGEHYETMAMHPVPGVDRWMYWMSRRAP